MKGFHMVTVGTILLVAGFILFLLSAIGWQPAVEPWRSRLIAAGLACWTLSILIGGVKL
jgi:hypothetical protein